MSSETYHEPYESLSTAARDMHRAITSLGEELEAIDWYAQRAEVCTDDDLRKVLLHNRAEEIEHAMMVLEWIRRHDPDFAAKSRTYLFTEAPITEIEAVEEKGATGEAAEPAAAASSAAQPRRPPPIGSLKHVVETP